MKIVIRGVAYDPAVESVIMVFKDEKERDVVVNHISNCRSYEEITMVSFHPPMTPHAVKLALGNNARVISGYFPDKYKPT